MKLIPRKKVLVKKNFAQNNRNLVSHFSHSEWPIRFFLIFDREKKHKINQKVRITVSKKSKVAKFKSKLNVSIIILSVQTYIDIDIYWLSFFLLTTQVIIMILNFFFEFFFVKNMFRIMWEKNSPVYCFKAKKNEKWKSETLFYLTKQNKRKMYTRS